jgi:hypothetical protein
MDEIQILVIKPDEGKLTLSIKIKANKLLFY